MQALPDHVLMMQIDCEVINTGLVHIKEDAIPIHLSARMRTGKKDLTVLQDKCDLTFCMNHKQSFQFFDYQSLLFISLNKIEYE